MKLMPEDRIKPKIQRWQRCLSYAVIMSAFCLIQTTQGQDSIKPAEKPRAAATITPYEWSTRLEEYDHLVTCMLLAPLNEAVLIGTAHIGDSRGITYYHCGEVHQFVHLTPVELAWSEELRDHNHSYSCPPNMVMTGRHHFGNSDGPTRYQCAKLKDNWGNDIQVVPGQLIDGGAQNELRFDCPQDQVLTHRERRDGSYNAHIYFKCATLW